MKNITFFYHTQGRFVRDEHRRIKYVDGKVDSMPPMDIDLVNYFDLLTLFKGLGYHDLKSVQWMHPNQICFNIGLMPLRGDNDVNRMCKAAMQASDSNECNIHLYFEHLVSGIEDAELVDPNEVVGAGSKAIGLNPNEVVDDGGKDGVSVDPHLVSDDDDYDSVEDSLYKPSKLTYSDSDSDTDKDADTSKKCHSKKIALNESYSEDECSLMSFEIDGYAQNSEHMRTPVSTDDEADSAPPFPLFRESVGFGQVSLEVGMEFNTLELFKDAVRDFNIAIGREIKWVKNDRQRARAVCRVDECPWKILCSWSSNVNTYQIKTLELEHTCCRVFRNKAATGGWVAKKLEPKLFVQPDLKKRHARDIMKEDFLVHLSDKKLANALKKTKVAVEGSEKEQYARTWDYLGELLRSNPGSTAKMDVLPRLDLPPLFERLYICLDACKKAFKAGCRPLIGLDGCFLNGYYGGQLLSAVSHDVNNQFLVIAYAVVDAETKDNWKWFLTLLLQDIGDHRTHGWNFISDQQKGLIPALKELMPGVHHRNCVVHIWKNFMKQWRDKELRGMVWECSKCTTEAAFKASMLKLKTMNERAWNYLNNIEPSAWVKAYFSHHPKTDNITNNHCEIWNGKIVRYRDKPILTMLEEIRCYIMRKLAGHKRFLKTYKGILPPVQQKLIDQIKVESNFWTPTYTGDPGNETYEVRRHRKRSQVGVSLTHHTCTCQLWQLTGMPCEHAIAAIAHKNERPEDYVHPWLTMNALNATYEYYIQPVNSQEYWAVTDHPQPEPPKLKRPIGRPKKRRRKDPVTDEGPSGQQKKLKKKYSVKCTKCGETGHYQKTCKGPVQPGYEQRRLAKIRKNKKRYATAHSGGDGEGLERQSQSESITQEMVANPPSPPQPPAVRPPPIRPRVQMTAHITPPPFNPSPSSAVSTQPIRPPPPPPVRPFVPPRNVVDAETSARNMVFQFMPTPGYMPPPST